MAVKCTIGGQEYELPILTIYALEICYPNIISLANPETNILQRMKDVLAIVSASLALSQPDVTVDMLSKVATPTDIRNIDDVIRDLLIESGLSKHGEETSSGEALATGSPGTI